jgi:hypothetical protein
MALFSECSLKCARKMLDSADIVREAMLRQLRLREQPRGDLVKRHSEDQIDHQHENPDGLGPSGIFGFRTFSCAARASGQILLRCRKCHPSR